MTYWYYIREHCVHDKDDVESLVHSYHSNLGWVKSVLTLQYQNDMKTA